MLIPSAFDPAQAPNSSGEPVLGSPEIRAAWVKPRAHPQRGRLGFLLWRGVLGIRALVSDPGIHNALSFARTFSPLPKGPWGSHFTQEQSAAQGERTPEASGPVSGASRPGAQVFQSPISPCFH